MALHRGIPAVQTGFVGLCNGGLYRCRLLGAVGRIQGKLYFQRLADRTGNLVLNGNNVVGLSVVGVRSEMITAICLNELCGDPESGTRLSYAYYSSRRRGNDSIKPARMPRETRFKRLKMLQEEQNQAPRTWDKKMQKLILIMSPSL